jgi:bifunctional ADP-heptose synthase (sugar kinase/adenylyltransferase)
LALEYKFLTLKNKGRTVYENGELVRMHTRKSDMTKLPRTLWNEKGREMISKAKGEILSDYGKEGWRVVSVSFGLDKIENTYLLEREAK